MESTPQPTPPTDTGFSVSGEEYVRQIEAAEARGDAPTGMAAQLRRVINLPSPAAEAALPPRADRESLEAFSRLSRREQMSVSLASFGLGVSPGICVPDLTATTCPIGFRGRTPLWQRIFLLRGRWRFDKPVRQIRLG